MEVFWKLPGLMYPMMQVRPDEMKILIENDKYKDKGGLLAIPAFWAFMDDGSVEWWPNSMEGEPCVVIRPPRPEFTRGGEPWM